MLLSMHSSPHSVVPPPQLDAHWPLEHTSPAAQTVSQVPQ